MVIYDCKGLQKALGIGRDAAYKIIKNYGFRVGDRTMRISEKQLERLTHGKAENEKTDMETRRLRLD